HPVGRGLAPELPGAVGRELERPAARPAEPSEPLSGRPSWAQPGHRARGPAPGPWRRRRKARPVRLPPTRREVAHAARPTWPRYGNSLRKALSERERPKRPVTPAPSRFRAAVS